MEAEAPVTVAVVSFNTRELLVRCLRSLEAEVRDGRANVVVVDNSSSDGSAEAARAQAPWARVLEPGKNLGFGPAVNLAAEHTNAAWLMAANADIALEPGALDAMMAAGSDPRVACVAPRLVLPGGETQHSVFALPTVPFTLAFNLGLHRLSPRLADALCLEGFWDPDRPRDVPWAIGACLLIRRTAFDAVGGFDSEQWMYAEDLDLGWRIRRAGSVTRYEPAARVLHQSAAATAVAFGDRRVDAFMAATYSMLLRRRGLARTWATAAINLGGAAVRHAWMSPLALARPRFRDVRAANRRWLVAHRQGLCELSTLRRDGG